MTDRPKRKRIPLAVRQVVVQRQGFFCKAGCGKNVSALGGNNIGIPKEDRTNFDHEPALALRDVNRAGTDYIPAQHSPKHIDALCWKCHRAKTSGSGATTAGTDIGKIKKERKRARAPNPKRHWPARKMQSKPFPKRRP